MNYEDHGTVQDLLKKCQDVEHDNRERAREAFHFCEKRDGQWEPSIVEALKDRPRYTFDKVGPIVDQIVGEIDSADFDARVRPAGGDATKETALIYDGIVRDIESRSNAQHTYTQAARSMVEGGLGGWLVAQDWVDDDSFDQDLVIKPVNNFEDRAFFDVNAELQDMSDSMHCFLITNIGMDAYKERWPEGSGLSVGEERQADVYTYKKEAIDVCQIWYKKPTIKELVLFSDGSVRELNEDLNSVMDELAETGVTEVSRRKRNAYKVMTRIFDGGGWLTDEQETVFHAIPLIPVYGNFHIREGKIIYRGHVERLIDPQRVYNYMRSREVEEVALAPKSVYWMTKEQAAGNEKSLANMNVSGAPVQFYEPDERAPGPPMQQGGAQVNPGLIQASQSTAKDLAEAAGIFGLNQGRADDGPMSGVAIQALQNKGDNSTIKYFSAMEVAITATCRLLVKAIPKVYDTNRQVRILNEDGSQEVMSVNDRVFDNETGKLVTANDLRKGKYDVTCDVGPAFKNRQQEAVKALSEAMAAMPVLGQIGGDILLKNINSPGVDVVAERLRAQMVQSGLIPQSQLTKEEQEAIQQAQMMAAQQPQEPTFQDKLAEAEIGRVQAETADVMSKAQERQDKIQVQLLQEERKAVEAQEKSEIEQIKLFMAQQAQGMKQQQAMIEAALKGQQAAVEALNAHADTLNKLREAMGADAVMGPNVARSYANQAEIVTESQDALDDGTR